MWVFLDDDMFEVHNHSLDEGEDYFYEPHLAGIKDQVMTIFNDINKISGKCYYMSNIIN